MTEVTSNSPTGHPLISSACVLAMLGSPIEPAVEPQAHPPPRTSQAPGRIGGALPGPGLTNFSFQAPRVSLSAKASEHQLRTGSRLRGSVRTTRWSNSVQQSDPPGRVDCSLSRTKELHRKDRPFSANQKLRLCFAATKERILAHLRDALLPTSPYPSTSHPQGKKRSLNSWHVAFSGSSSKLLARRASYTCMVVILQV